MIEKALKYRKITLLFFLLALIWGYFSFDSLNQRENPENPVSFASVQTVFPGASPQQVEQFVTRPIEERINESKHFASIHSTSSANVSFIAVEVKIDVDNDEAFEKLREKIQMAEADLPQTVQKPVINDDLAQIATQFIHFNVDSDHEIDSLRPLLKEWKTQLRTVNGVSHIDIVGLAEQEVRIQLDFNLLKEKHIPWTLVAKTLEDTYERSPLGLLEKDEKNHILQMTGEWETAEDISETIILTDQGGQKVLLNDLSHTYLANKEHVEMVYHNGDPAVTLVIHAEAGADIPSLQDQIDQKIKELELSLPDYATFKSGFSQKEKIDAMFSDMGTSLLLGMIAVIFVCYLGLTLGSAIIVALAIPISIAIGFIPLMWLGIDLNQITIASLVIALGILVDDAIVVNDNIERRKELGDKPFQASLTGSREVSISILTATLTTSAAFLPLYFLPGDVGEFVRAIPIVVTLTVFASLALALTIIPIFRHWAADLAINKHKRKTQPGLLGPHIHRLGHAYKRLLRRLIERPIITGIIALLIGSSSFVLLPFLDVQYFPKSEHGELLIDTNLAEGTSLEKTDRTVREAANWVQDQPGVISVSAYAGRTTPQFYYNELEFFGSHVGQLYVIVDTDEVETEELLSPWRNTLQDTFSQVQIIPRELEQGPPVGVPIEVRIMGPNIDEMSRISEQIQNELSNIDGAVNVSDSMDYDRMTTVFDFKKDKLHEQGVSERDLSATIRLATEGIQVASLQHDDQLIDVTIYAGESNQAEKRLAEERITELLVPSNAGENIRLDDLVTRHTEQGYSNIQRRNLMRTISVHSYTEGRYVNDILDELVPKIDQMSLPPGYFIEYGGESEATTQAFADIGKLSMVVALLIFIIMVIQFHSFLIPIIIMSTVYLAAGGAIIGLFVTNTPIGFMALLGVVSLSGLVVRNGIILIEFIRQTRKQGSPLLDGVAEASRTRLRPILLTMATAIAGLFPMAIFGGSLWQPMAMTIISGLIFSTILTLFVVPSFYVFLTRTRRNKQSKVRFDSAGRAHYDELSQDSFYVLDGTSFPTRAKKYQKRKWFNRNSKS